MEGRAAIVPRSAPAVSVRAQTRRHGRAHGGEGRGVIHPRRAPRFPLPAEETSPLETIALVAFFGAAAVLMLLWATGEIAGRVFGGVWPSVAAAAMGTVLVRFPAHLGDP